LDAQKKKAEADLLVVKTAIDTAKGTIDKQTPEQQKIQARITVLTNAINEVKQSTGGYKQAYADAKKAIDELWSYREDKKKKLEGALKEAESKRIAELIKSHGEWIQAQEKMVQEASKAVDGARINLAKAQDDLGKAQKSLEELKGYSGSVQGQIAYLKTFRVDVEKLEENMQDPYRNHKMYLLVSLMKEPFDAPPLKDLKTEDQLKKALEAAWAQLDKANEAARDAKSKLDMAEASLKKEREELTRRQTNRVKDLLKKVETPDGPKAP
jgi:DNA repair exonuclease SbcCD ATPase subunit